MFVPPSLNNRMHLDKGISGGRPRFQQADNKKAIAVIARSEGSRRGNFTAASMQQTSVNSIGPTLPDSKARHARLQRSRNRCCSKLAAIPPELRQAQRGNPLDIAPCGRGAGWTLY